MGYFEGLTNASFKNDRDGNAVFFPWGVLGRGRVLPDQAVEAKLRKFVSLYYKISLPVIILVGAFLGWKFSMLLLPILYTWFYFGSKPLVSACAYSDEKLSAKESYRNSAKKHNKIMLWVMFVSSMLFVVAGVFIVLMGNAAEQKMIGFLSLIFFGLCAMAIGYMLKIKYST